MSSPDVFAVWAPEPESVSLVVATVGGDADLITVAMEGGVVAPRPAIPA